MLPSILIYVPIMGSEFEHTESNDGSFIYFWREPEWNAWKIGKGDPNTRMMDYAEKNNLRYDPSSLRCFSVSSGLLAYRIEQLIHVALVANHGFRRFPGKGQGLELFLAPQGANVPDALTEIITRTISSVDSRTASAAYAPALGFVDADIFLPSPSQPSTFYDFLIGEGFSRTQILRRDIPIDQLDELEERYKRKYEPQFVFPRHDSVQSELNSSSELSDPTELGSYRALSSQADTADSVFGSRSEISVGQSKVILQTRNGCLKGLAWLSVIVLTCVVYYQAFLAPSAKVSTLASKPAGEVAPAGNSQAPERPAAPPVPTARSGSDQSRTTEPSQSPQRRAADVNFTCYRVAPNQNVRLSVSVKDGKFRVVQIGPGAQRDDRSTRYEISSTNLRWEGVSFANPNNRMVGELYNKGSQTRYRET